MSPRTPPVRLGTCLKTRHTCSRQWTSWSGLRSFELLFAQCLSGLFLTEVSLRQDGQAARLVTGSQGRGSPASNALYCDSDMARDPRRR